MKLNYLPIIILLAVAISLFFWPSMISVHYSGDMSCPMISSIMPDCSDMSGGAPILNIHISALKNALSFIIIGLAFLAVVKILLFAFRLDDIASQKISFSKTVSLRIKIYNIIADTRALFGDQIFLGLCRGAINTRAF